MPNSNLQVVSRLLGATVEELDISPLQYELAVRRYSDLGQWLVALGIGDPDVYPQGSFRLGTVLRPTAGGDFDIDLVFLRFLAKESITQEELRAQAGKLLRDYIAARGASNGNPELKERGRCWEFVYTGDRFHMDVLPVIPDPDGDETAVLLSDQDMFLWQHSNPIGYADWFWSSMGEAVDVGRAQLAAALSRDVEDVVRRPKLVIDANGNLPHIYPDGSLCLHEPGQWSPGDPIAETTLPWTCEWLLHYEFWRATGEWCGSGGNHTGPIGRPTTPQRRHSRCRGGTRASRHKQRVLATPGVNPADK